jgi:hypothetical protein
LDCLHEEREPPVPPGEAIGSLELVLALYRAAATGMTIDLPLVSAHAFA